jgi:radical SAM family RiPP maturation amino acid epimerase
METPQSILTRMIHPSVAHTKRFLERWTADPQFRERLDQDSAGTMRAYKLQADPERLRPLYTGTPLPEGEEPCEEVIHYRNFIAQKLGYRAQILREAAPAHPDFQRWRQRQMRRAEFELGKARSGGIIHSPACFELSKGCTVKCWFCGIGALPFEGPWLYTPEHAALWRQTLTILGELCGEAAKYAFCYWGTDPMDNPDYEKYLSDFQEQFGRLPQTTTAIGYKDPARFRRLLEMSRSAEGFVERISVLSLSIFNRIMDEFSAEELLRVELVQQFNDGPGSKAVAGAGRERALRKHAEKNVPLPENIEDGGTIACVSGFLFNMFERSVKLISPCTANARWPLGYIVFDEFRFRDGDDLRQKMMDTVRQHMQPTVSAAMPARLTSCLELSELRDNGFSVSSRFIKATCEELTHGADLGRRLAAGTYTVGELAQARNIELGVDHVDTFQVLSALLNLGILSEEPAAPPPQLHTLRTTRAA